ncbi:uncharacterized protein RCC_05382 [Ramularia collo-cygni]|uniref:Uncharacterized protein n=1 Tax=Ramularia collo-cygni TaxID=112498 RepID=A0A2D3UT40_9PEZI|nr:uncharacterized protein RCC_05382 [Ramularia collo-cygni]CZT19531.1 uncharacterized protein RCC_05382 [Ramularia collo-cygni]
MTLLHHRRDLDDIRLAYDSDYGSSDRSCQRESGSDRSYSSAPTQYSSSSSKRPQRIHYNTCVGNGQEATPRYLADQPPCGSPRSSVGTYASEVEDDDAAELPEYEVPEYTMEPYAPTAIPATPSDFSELFPSHRRLIVRHDDSTIDGNMNLRIDTEVTMHGGRRCDMSLFHLRMHDLRDREFSLRRYCRDSGREVCHTGKLQKSPVNARPGFQRSLSNALSGMRSKSSEQKMPTLASLARNDSGYGSTGGSVRSSPEKGDDRRPSSAHAALQQERAEPNTIKLEYSNYAQVAIRRAGRTGSKRYEFEYWGVQYVWKRLIRDDGQSRAVSFQLLKGTSDLVLAYIVPFSLSPAQMEEERAKGGWIPPCSLWIADETIVSGPKDVADVIVSSGLIALVDNCINERFHSKDSKQLFVPRLQLGVEYIGPKRLINEMFKRNASGTHSRRSSTGRPPSSVSGPTGPTRQTSQY